MRVFLAADVPATLQEGIGARLCAAATRLPAARYTPAGNLHLTLHFFGERAPERVDEIAAALAPAVAAHAPFALELAAAGSFPPNRPRVVWLGLAPHPELLALHADVVRVLASLGEELEARPYRPHLTLARVKEPWRRDALETLRDAMRELESERFPVRSLTIFESRLGRQGARHEPRRALPLGPPAEAHR